MGDNLARKQEMQRRQFLRLSGGAVLLAAGAGCGGGGGDGGTTTLPDSNPIIATDRRSISVNGGILSDAARKLTLTLPAGALSETTPVSLVTRRDPYANVPPRGFDFSPNQIDLLFDSRKLKPNQNLILEVPWTHGYDLIGTVLYLTNPDGGIIPLTTEYNAQQQVLRGTISQLDTQALRTADDKFHLFAAGAQFASRSISERYEPRTIIPTRATRANERKNVAVIVHGILNEGKDVKHIADYLASEPFHLPVTPNGPPGVTGRVYDTIDNDLTYPWYLSITENAQRLVDHINSRYANAEVVDIYAHSMGGLVSRYAIEKLGMSPRINKLVTFGTPHYGVPLKGIQISLLIWLAEEVLNLPDNQGLHDLLRDSDFIQSLNSGDYLAFQSKYCYVAGQNYQDFKSGLGAAIDVIYGTHNPDRDRPHDGIVPVNSAVAENETYKLVPYNHSQLVDNLGDANYKIEHWIVTEFKGTVQ